MCHSAYASVVRQDFVVKTGFEPVVKDKRLVLLQGLGIMSIPTFNIPLRTPIPPPDYLRLRSSVLVFITRDGLWLHNTAL